MLYYIGAVTIAAVLQIGTIYFLRADFLNTFLYAIPFIVAYQFLFLWSYAKAPNFIVIWFITTALTNILAFGAGYFLYREHVSFINIAGIGFIMIGIVLLNLK